MNKTFLHSKLFRTVTITGFLTLLIVCCCLFISSDNNKSTAASSTSYNKITINNSTLSVSNANNVSLTNSNNYAKISASPSALSNAKFEFKNKFNFDNNPVSRLDVFANASVADTKLVFYADNDNDSFAEITLPKKKKNDEYASKDISVNVYDKKLKGNHSIYFKIVPADSSNCEVYIKSAEFVESSIPVVYFDINEAKGSVAAMNADTNHNTKCYGDMSIQVPDNYVGEYTKEQLESTKLELDYIRGRGNSTWMANQRKPYKFKLKDKSNLFGMGANKHWVLLSNYYENSLIRNKITYWLGDKLSFNFTPQSVFVEVVMNGEYYGIYQLCEHVRVDENRVEIDDLDDYPDATDADTISGGYMLSMGSWGADGKSFKTSKNNFYAVESPSFEDKVNVAQFNYIKNYIQQVEDAIYSPNFKNNRGQHYSDLVDIDTLVDFYWVQEISLNSDIGTGSTYCYKVKNGKLYFGPLWDFDVVAWGASDQKVKDYLYARYFSWYDQLFKDSYFTNKLKERWPYINQKMNDLCKRGGALDRYIKEIEIASRYNFEKYPESQSGMGFGFGNWNIGGGGANQNQAFEREYNEFIGNVQVNNGGWNMGGWNMGGWNMGGFGGGQQGGQQGGWNMGGFGGGQQGGWNMNAFAVNDNNNDWNLNNNNNNWNNNLMAVPNQPTVQADSHSALQVQDLLEDNPAFVKALKANVKEAYSENDAFFNAEDASVFDHSIEDQYSADYILSHFAKSNHKEAAIFVKVWAKTRAEWITNNINKFEQLNFKPNMVQRGDFGANGTKFDPDNGQDIITLSSFGSSPELKDPKKDGYVFTGWYDAQSNTYYDPNDQSSTGFFGGFGGFGAAPKTYKAQYVPKDRIIPAEKIILDRDEVYIDYTATSYTIHASTYPANATMQHVLKYKVDNQKAGSMTGNKLTIYDTGDLTVTVSDPVSKASAKCVIHINEDAKLRDVSTTQKNITVKSGETINMPISFSPSNTAVVRGEWASKDKNVAYVDGAHVLHGVKEGTVEIRYFCFDISKYLSYNVTVTRNNNPTPPPSYYVWPTETPKPTKTPKPTATPTKTPTKEPTKIPTNTPTTKPTTTPTVKPTSSPFNDVKASVSVVNEWSDGAICSITVTNTSNKTLNGWTFEFDFTRGISDIWDATLVSQSGNHFVVSNPTWAPTLAPGESYTFNFMATASSNGTTVISNYSLK